MCVCVCACFVCVRAYLLTVMNAVVLTVDRSSPSESPSRPAWPSVLPSRPPRQQAQQAVTKQNHTTPP